MRIKKGVALLGSALLGGAVVGLVTGPAQAATYTPSSATVISPPDSTSSGASGSLVVNGAGGLVTDVDIRLNAVSHTIAGDLDVELVGPNGQAVMLMSDDCGSTSGSTIDSTLTFDDSAPTSLGTSSGTCPTGTYRPSNNGAGDPMPSPVTGITLSVFDGSNPNGTWVVRAVDDAPGDTGSISGFQLTIQTGAFSMVFPSNGTDAGPGSPYPLTLNVAGRQGRITDLDVILPGFTDTFVDDVDLLLVAPNGTNVMLMSDVCLNANVTNKDYVIDDEAARPFPASASPCPTGRYKPTNIAPGGAADPMQPPAPAGPYGTTLSAFDGLDPNGDWKLYAMDDFSSGGNGFLIGAPTLGFSLTDVAAPDTRITSKPKPSFRRKAKVAFTSTEAGSHFQCKLDGKAWKACTSPARLTRLSVRHHRVKVRAIDAAGNVDPTPARTGWRVKARP